MLNFLPPGPIKQNSDRWRSIVAAIVLVMGFLIIIAYQVKFFNKQVDDASNSFKVLSNKLIPQKPNSANCDNLPIVPKVEVRYPELTATMISSTNFTATSIIAKDQQTGMVLFKKNEYQKRPLASITKLMSALVILEKKLDWVTSTKVISDKVLDNHMYAGDTYTLEELWKASLIGSSNKAILTLADYSANSRVEFVARMNAKAKELGMSDTIFFDPSGLDADNVSTASDVAILLNEALSQDKIREALNQREMDLYSKERKQKHHIWNTDWLLLGWIPNQFVDFRGGKTGFIEASGYNFAMQVADKAGHVLNVVVLGADKDDQRFTEARDVAEWIFKSYKWPQ